ncbi:MAG: hypothetical protein CL847_05160 [Crocinitomicaceae bacterium]|nr:hypothetical protein [Crocinitomicaceae bacterium]|tara:strand:+ start:5292 stop:5936 length:645 start_codon:yes stop_codon:yes gene_type:complete
MDITNVIKGGVSIALKNFFSLLAASILYFLTIWIPYLNVGTTIAMISLPAALSRGEVINPTEIFNSKYRKNMGNFFLLMALMLMGIQIGLLFLIIPGIVLTYAWSMALLLLVDKGLNPIQALHESNKLTYGHKLNMFLIYLIISIGFIVILFLIGSLGTNQECADAFYLDPLTAMFVCGAGWSKLLQAIVLMLYYPIQLGVMAMIYKSLCGTSE